VTEHSVIEVEVPTLSGRYLYEREVRCSRCGRVSNRLGASLESASRSAWEGFLRMVPWDCDAAIVESVMRR
jgi:hypothetical protein